MEQTNNALPNAGTNTPYNQPQPQDDLRYLPLTSDAYLNEQLNYFNDLIETSSLPQQAKKLLFGVFDRTTVLSNYESIDLQILLAKAASIFAGIRIYMPPEKMTPDIERELDNFELLHYKMLKRGYHGFERKQQQTRITQATINRSDLERQGGGFFSRLFGGGR